MEAKSFDIPTHLEVLPLGENGEVELLPFSGKNRLNASRLPCGLPPILPDNHETLHSFMKDPGTLPLFDLDAVQRLIPIQPNVSSLYSVHLCPLQTTLNVKRDMMTGKLLGFTEEIKDLYEGAHNTSASLCRAPGPPDAGVKGSSSSFPFWPGGMEEPWGNLLKKESLDTSLFDEDLLDTPPGFEQGMKFERKVYDDQVDYGHPHKIRLQEVLAMEHFEMESLEEELEAYTEEIDLTKAQAKNNQEEDDAFLRLTSLPVLKIQEADVKQPAVQYDWAVIEDAKKPVEEFREKLSGFQETANRLQWDFELDPFQQRAVMHLERKENVFVAAHTSAGKTVVAEYAIELSRKHVTRVIYTSPIKALSNQKYRDFKEKFVDVGLITGDVQINPTAFCLIMTTEILRSILYHGSDVVRELEWVIFDEVHYINDSDRGVVWEEVFIMLPNDVNLIMLSATVPNTAQFAEWLGGIKKRKIFVISTSRRPVPLEHHLYTGSTAAKEPLFKIVDAEGNFLDNNYMKACDSKVDKRSNTGPKGQRHTISLAQEKTLYVSLLGYLEKNDLLPCVCFTFSRKKCNALAEVLCTRDLTDNSEKDKIEKIFRNSIKELKKEDQDLPQVYKMHEYLRAGYGVHHSGILPILKEVVEMLFQRSLLKILFATETFAMGINMPARTVVFDSVRKHDGREFRDLLPSEYIQMAGRAGRRGKDDRGTVIVLCKADVPHSLSLNRMMRGQPMNLESQFKLTYSMILNLLKRKVIRVEDVIRSSFRESDNQKHRKRFKELLQETRNRHANHRRVECTLCDTDLRQYTVAVKESRALRREVMAKKCAQAVGNKVLTTGRVLVTCAGARENVPCLLLKVDKDNNCKVLAVCDKSAPSSSPVAPEISPWTTRLLYPAQRRPEVLDITFGDIHVISNKSLRIDEETILKECKRMQLTNSSPRASTSSAFQELCSLCESNLEGFTSAKLVLKDMDFAQKVHMLERYEKSFENFTCVKCPEFLNHFANLSEVLDMEQQIEHYAFRVSEESAELHPEYESRKQVLKRLGYIDAEEGVQLKGCVAREMSQHELLITELLVKSLFNECTPEEVAALLSCMVFQQKCDDAKLQLPSHMLQKIKEIREVAMEISAEQGKQGIMDPEFVSQYNFYLAPVVYEWGKGVSFAKIMESTDIEEGIIVRSIQRLSELLKDVRNSAKMVGDTALAQKMDDASRMIRRDIVFAASLYTR